MKAGRSVLRGALLLLVAAFALEAYFALRVVLMTVVDPSSTTFQRSEAWRLVRGPQPLVWRQQWVSYEHIASPLKRAVIAAEDAGFTEHSGVEWDALEKAWERNQRAEAATDRQVARESVRAARPGAASSGATRPVRPAKVVGGSTITQQLAKNVFLDSERSLLRKGQELALAYLMEAVLGKRRILEIYLNSVEWGEGVFGAQAASERHFRIGADVLGPAQAARLAVMLPAPKRFEKRPSSPYVGARAATIAARMGGVELP